MSDDPFAAFKEGQPPVEAPAKEKKPRKKKASGNGKAPPEAVAPVPPKKERKARKPRAVKEFKLPISTFLEIGPISSEEGGVIMSVGAGLQKLPKKSRGKIVAALSKIFG